MPYNTRSTEAGDVPQESTSETDTTSTPTTVSPPLDMEMLLQKLSAQNAANNATMLDSIKSDNDKIAAQIDSHATMLDSIKASNASILTKYSTYFARFNVKFDRQINTIDTIKTDIANLAGKSSKPCYSQSPEIALVGTRLTSITKDKPEIILNAFTSKISEAEYTEKLSTLPDAQLPSVFNEVLESKEIIEADNKIVADRELVAANESIKNKEIVEDKENFFDTEIIQDIELVGDKKVLEDQESVANNRIITDKENKEVVEHREKYIEEVVKSKRILDVMPEKLINQSKQSIKRKVIDVMLPIIPNKRKKHEKIAVTNSTSKFVQLDHDYCKFLNSSKKNLDFSTCEDDEISLHQSHRNFHSIKEEILLSITPRNCPCIIVREFQEYLSTDMMTEDETLLRITTRNSHYILNSEFQEYQELMTDVLNIDLNEGIVKQNLLEIHKKKVKIKRLIL